MTNSREKGKRGEREAAEFLRHRNFEARRGQQYRGGEDSPDLITSLPCHIEVKFTERLNIYAALEQAERDASDGEIPVVMHRRKRKPWIVILKAEDYFHE